MVSPESRTVAIDLVKLRQLAEEFGYWPATTNPEDIARHRRLNGAFSVHTKRDDSGRHVLIGAQLSAADAALRERITELSVHLRCGQLRGPVYKDYLHRWQSCRCEDSPQRWGRCDVSREYDLCVICARATSGGTSRWSWIACEECRAVNASLAFELGFQPFALGRHSLMNGVGVRGGLPADERERQLARLAEFAKHHGYLWHWRNAEVARLAMAFNPQEDIPLSVWQKRWPPSRQASRDAINRMLGGEAVGPQSPGVSS